MCKLKHVAVATLASAALAHGVMAETAELTEYVGTINHIESAEVVRMAHLRGGHIWVHLPDTIADGYDPATLRSRLLGKTLTVRDGTWTRGRLSGKVTIEGLN